MKKCYVLLMMILSLCLTACVSSSPPMINLQPQINTQFGSNIGNGKPVVLQVIDARPANSFSSAKIEPSQNVAQIFKNQLSQGLQNAGFTLVPIQSDKPLNHMTVTILAIDYRTMKGIASSDNEVFVSAKAAALTTSGLYTRTYNASNYSDSYMDAMMVDPSDAVNRAVNQLLNTILSDQKMMGTLAK